MESSQHSLDGSTSQAGGPIRLTERKTPDHFPGPGHTLLVGDQVSESFLGPSSIPSLCVEAQATCERLASSLHILDAGGEQSLYSDHDTSALLANVAQANECLQHMVQETRTLPEPGDDEVAPTLPPRALLEASIHPYFKYISPILPIYERQSVIAAICGQYGADSPDPVWIIAFNSIVLQTLDAKLVATENIESIGYGGILEDALLYQLRLNVRRCYNNLKTLAHPSFVNAQALLSMVGHPYPRKSEVWNHILSLSSSGVGSFKILPLHYFRDSLCPGLPGVAVHWTSPEVDKGEGGGH
jgi:hypothetical protein